MARKRFIFFHHCQSLLKFLGWGNRDKLRKHIAFACLILITTVLCLTISPASAFHQPNQNPQSKVNEGKKLYDAGRYNEASQLLQQAAKQYQQLGDTVREAIALGNLSLAYQQLGFLDLATQAINSSLRLQGYPTNPNSEFLAQTLDIQGRLQLIQGKTSEALATWEQATKIYNQTGDTKGSLRSLINQAQALRSLGFYRRATSTLLDVNKKLQSQPNSVEKAIALRSLGDALQLSGELEQAQVTLKQSLAIAQSLNSPLEIGASYLSLANHARAQKQTTAAISLYQETFKITPEPLTKAQALVNQFSLLIETQPATAQSLIPQIQSQLDQLQNSSASVYARINFGQSLIKIAPNDPTSTARLFASAIQQARSLGDRRAEAYALVSLGSLYEQTQQWEEGQKLTQQALSLAQSSNAADIFYQAAWQLGRLKKIQGDFKSARAAYDAAVSSLESIRTDLVKASQDVQFNFRDSVEPLYRQSVELLLQAEQGKPNPQILDKARQRIEALQLAELDDFFREACLQGQKVLLDQLVDRDNPTAAVLYPIILPKQLQVIVKIPKQPLRHYSTEISQEEVEKTVFELRKNLVKPSALKAVRTSSQLLYNWLIKPIESELAGSGVDTLVFILDTSLRNIPVSVLYDGSKYLVEKYAVALSVGLQIQDPKRLTRKHLNALTAGLTEPPAKYSNFAPLPAIKTEFELISQAGVSTTTLLDQQFTSKALSQKFNAAPFNIVHLATHGEFSSRQEETFILAADGPINVNQFDDILSSREQTRPEAVELLVLSACQTAQGDNRATLGLAGAAVRAGARSTIASLWQIDDEATAIFVGDFYKELRDRQITKAQALRRAQLTMLNHPNYYSPSYWSAYILIGNWL